MNMMSMAMRRSDCSCLITIFMPATLLFISGLLSLACYLMERALKTDLVLSGTNCIVRDQWESDAHQYRRLCIRGLE